MKLVYSNHTYDMLPFVVVTEDGVKKLNFPHLPDEYKPVVNISSNSSFSVEFTKKPREVNAFLIDYDADTTEITPLTRLGKTEFGLGNLYGLRTVEVRVFSMMEGMLHTLVLLTFKNLTFRVTVCREELSLAYLVEGNNEGLSIFLTLLC